MDGMPVLTWLEAGRPVAAGVGLMNAGLQGWWSMPTTMSRAA
jgi:hypothetical protein